MSLRVLDEEIKNKKLHGIYLLYGEETYDIENYIEKMKRCYENLQNGVNFFIIDKNNIDSLADICESVSFFGLQKFVLIKNTGLKFNKEILENITNPELVIVILEQSVDKRTSEYKYLSKKALCVEFNKLNEKDAVFYIKRMLNAYKIIVDDKTAQYMLEVCSENKQILINEFRKIVAFLNESDTLTKEIIDKICSKTLDAKIFDLMDLIVNKEKKKALIMLDEIISQGTYIGVITSLLFKQIKQIYQIKLMEEKIKKDGTNINIASELGIHPFVFSKLKSVSNKYAINKLEDIMLDFDEYDENSKTGKIDSKIGLQTIIATM